jgi:hypothetical protein
VHFDTVRDALLLRPLVQVVIERGHNGASGGEWAAPSPPPWRRRCGRCWRPGR